MKNEDRIKQMIIRSEKILRYCDKQTYDTFTADDMLVEACVFNLSQIGELCHGVTSEYTAAHPNIPWNEMYGLRNRIVHDYDGVNLKLVWEIISNDLPELLRILQSLK